MGQGVPDVQASHLTDRELLSYAEHYVIKYKELPPSLQEELIKRFRSFVDDADSPV